MYNEVEHDYECLINKKNSDVISLYLCTYDLNGFDNINAILNLGKHCKMSAFSFTVKDHVDKEVGLLDQLQVRPSAA